MLAMKSSNRVCTSLGTWRDILIEYRYAEGKLDRLPDLAAELVRLKVDVLLVGGTAAATAAK
jgi:hypothetical protein